MAKFIADIISQNPAGLALLAVMPQDTVWGSRTETDLAPKGLGSSRAGLPQASEVLSVKLSVLSAYRAVEM